MIRLLTGIVHSNEDKTLILLVNGVGYQVHVPNDILAENDEEITLHIHTHIREDAFTLYGFRNKKELNFYELLLSINGVGPKMALEILNEPVENIQNAIFTGNEAALTKISGVGKKTAQRIILELKNKVTPIDASLANFSNQTENPEAIMALESLGYRQHHIKKVLSTMEEDLRETESIIRWFLQQV